MRPLLPLLALLLLAGAALAQAERPEVPTHSEPVVQAVQDHLNRLCDQHDARLARITTEAALREELAAARRRFLKLLDLDPDAPRSAPRARLVGTLDFPDYRIEKVVLEARPGVPVTCSVYVPKQGPARKPALLIPHGHSGRDRPVYQNGYQRFAKVGFVVLAKDGWGKGERRATGHGPAGGQLLLVNRSLLALELADNVACVDYLLSRPDVDGERLGMVGLSGGGSQTLYTAAIEPRLKAASPTCAVTTFRADLADTTMCVCELAPDILTVGDHGLFLAMAYPRPLLVVNGTQDAIFPIAGARAAVQQARQLYAAGGHGDRVEFAEYVSPHDWTDAMIERQVHWFRARFGLPPLAQVPPGDGPRDPRLLACFPNGDLPPGSLTLTDLSRARIPAAPAARDLGIAERTRARWSGEPALPARVERRDLGPDARYPFDRLQLSWPSGLGGPVTAAVTRPAGAPAGPARRLVIRLDRDRTVPELERLYWDERLRMQEPVVDLAYTGKALTPVQEGQVGTALIASGRSLLAERVRDLLVSLQVLRQEGLSGPETEWVLVGHGFDGVVLLAAGPFLPRNARLVLDQTPISYTSGADLDFSTPALLAPPVHWTILPGLGRAGDLSHLLVAAAPRPLLLAHPHDAAQQPLSKESLAALLGEGKDGLPAHVDALTNESPRTAYMRRLNALLTRATEQQPAVNDRSAFWKGL